MGEAGKEQRQELADGRLCASGPVEHLQGHEGDLRFGLLQWHQKEKSITELNILGEGQ